MNIYEEALASQGACNLSGLAYSLPQVMDEIWKEAKAQGKDTTDEVNRHPVIRLFLEQMAYLNGCQIEDRTGWLYEHIAEAKTKKEGR